MLSLGRKHEGEEEEAEAMYPRPNYKSGWDDANFSQEIS